MKYLIQIEVDTEIGTELERDHQQLDELMGAWQALNPIGMYFALTRRAITIILEAANEDAFFEALHKTWVVSGNYPEVWPVVSGEEFPGMMQRLGLG